MKIVLYDNEDMKMKKKSVLVVLALLLNTDCAAFGNGKSENEKETEFPSSSPLGVGIGIGIGAGRCRNITLKPTEYKLNEEGLETAYVPGHIFTNFEGNDENGSVSVCLRYSRHFETCPKWELKRSEVRWIPGTLNLVDTVHGNVEYKVDEYEVTARDSLRVCIPDDQLPPSPSLELADYNITLVGWTLSAVGMLVVLVIYCILPCSATDLSPIRSHVVSLLLAYTFLAASEAFGRVNDDFACYLLAIGRQFTVISAMCWLNVLSFELWWRFRGNRVVPINVDASKRSRRFRVYSHNCYGWGVASVVVVVSVVLDNGESVYRPNYLYICQINGRTAEALLYYGPITLCVLVNLILFALTSVSIFRVRRYISLGSSQIQILCMSIKLMLVMGIPWCLEVIEWAVPIRPEYWIVLDMLTPFQGVILFVIYAFRRHVRSEMKKILVTYMTYYCCFCVAKRVATTPLKQIASDPSSSHTTETSV